MQGPLPVTPGQRVLVTGSPTGEDLWTQLRPLVPDRVHSVFVCGPFYDAKLAFLQRMLTDVGPTELVVGIDPASVEMDPDQIPLLQNSRFVNVAGLPRIGQRRERCRAYLHAKALWFKGEDGELLVSGSANPSAPAFLSTSGARNVEVVIADTTPGVGQAIGLEELILGPGVTSADWAEVRARRALTPEGRQEIHGRALVAVPAVSGFTVQADLQGGLLLEATDEIGGLVGTANVSRQSGTAIEALDVVRDTARYLRAHGVVTILVHRPAEIAKNLGGTNRQALRQALGRFEEDPIQLEALLRLTEKVIFDSDDVVRPHRLREASTDATGKAARPGPETLMLDAAGRPSPDTPSEHCVRRYRRLAGRAHSPDGRRADRCPDAATSKRRGADWGGRSQRRRNYSGASAVRGLGQGMP